MNLRSLWGRLPSWLKRSIVWKVILVLGLIILELVLDDPGVLSVPLGHLKDLAIILKDF